MRVEIRHDDLTVCEATHEEILQAHTRACVAAQWAEIVGGTAETWTDHARRQMVCRLDVPDGTRVPEWIARAAGLDVPEALPSPVKALP